MPVTLLTTRQLIELRPERSASVALSELTYAQVGMTTFGTSEYLYVGLNSGEWGGGLRRISRATGQTVKIENETAGPCRGPLDTSCDPVQGIALLPWRPGCIAAAVGLIHFEPHGRVVGICGERVETLYSRNISLNGRETTGDEGVNVAFFGIVRSGNLLLAAGHDGLYRIGAGGRATFEPFPAFRQIGGVHLSLGQPDVILAVTRINQRASISGAVPLLIPR